jgi:uncharacterized membrane protein YfcA
MTKPAFELFVGAVGAAFAIAFGFIVMPPLLESGDVLGALGAGFVNPYASGYSLDAILCGVILIAWIIHDRTTLGIRHGWIAIPLAFIPGVATAFAVYLILRSRQIQGTLR